MSDFDDELLSKQDPGSLNGRVTLTYDGDVAVICVECGENRLNARTVGLLLNALDDVQRNEKAKALITIGDGKFYCNGMDINWLAHVAQADASVGIKFRDEYMQKLLTTLLTFPMPTIAAINGHAFAGGAVLSGAHDYIVMNSERGWWCLNEVFINLRFSHFTTALMRMKLGAAFHKGLVLGHRFTAQEALEYGLAKDICPGNHLLKRAVILARNLVARQPYDREVLKNMKADVYRAVYEAGELDKVSSHPGSVFALKSNV